MKVLTRFWDLSRIFPRSQGEVSVSRDAVHVSTLRRRADARGGVPLLEGICFTWQMKELGRKVKHPSLPQRSGQGAPELFPPPSCQGLPSDETFQPSLPRSPPDCPRQGTACCSPLPSRLPSAQQTHRCNTGLGVPLPITPTGSPRQVGP